jgi:hypothetical protein
MVMALPRRQACFFRLANKSRDRLLLALCSLITFTASFSLLQRAMLCRYAAEKHAIGLLDDGVDPHLVRKPGMMRVQNLTPDGPVGVLKPCCTIVTDRTKALTTPHRIGWAFGPSPALPASYYRFMLSRPVAIPVAILRRGLGEFSSRPRE